MPRYGVELSLRSHLAQMTWDGAETVSPVLAAGASRLSAEEDWALASAQDQFARWASWQIRTGKVRHDIQAAGISSERATELLQPLLSGQRPEWVLLELARVGLSAETLIAALAA